MSPRQAILFVKKCGIALESARGPVPNLAETIAGETIRGSWWGHRKSGQIFVCSRAIRASRDVLVCRLMGGKVTYVHSRLWPALVKLRDQFDPKRLAALREIHTAEGRHEIEVIPFPKWVPLKVTREAARLTVRQATGMLQGVDGT